MSAGPRGIAVVKIGSSSITQASGELDDAALVKLADDLAGARAEGRRMVLVMSGAIAAGMPALGISRRPADMGTLQAIAAVGQPRLLERMGALLGKHDLVAGQVLLTPYDFFHRSQYLHARVTLQHLLDLGVLPIVNENDTVADDEIRYGDNDRLAALVSHMLGAELLLMLTDTAGVFTADPRHDQEASLIEEIVEIDAALERVVGGAGTERGSGGMASKLAAAKIAAWSGVRTVIASAALPGVVADAVAGRSVGTSFAPRRQRLPSRKLWIAFARASEGKIVVDAGARRALVEGGKSLLPAGVREVEGGFDVDATVEIVDEEGAVFAKGLCRYTSEALRSHRGQRTADLPEGLPHEVVHRDDLVVLP
jgi:glutamate 5-kinase